LKGVPPLIAQLHNTAGNISRTSNDPCASLIFYVPETKKQKICFTLSNERGEADIKLVWEEWFWDSLGFGGTYSYLV
jgi:hypothetical protein